MSVESAKDYIKRMREDESFRHAIHACEDEASSWSCVRAQGFDFTLQEFKQAQELIYQEYGIVPIV